ncbi:aldo/keto reductase [Paracraurococcus ruber]|uniref:NADP-dependent oxidoreductase n=1 Tax=Paracraurococcus ruber TaxID=77675 RepID=A0ABS1CWS1_9PROT|nr:aldo/keto reductase [Paracraurococcus ruber]MBK1658828.1 NADP-dependent oxidoreductase [Paracraurococcus ruber]TDG29761.1 aldo/keto reductase [Paracraurococcus ruber]
MDYRSLGRSGITVSRYCLGAMMFGGPTDAATSERLIARAAAAGINFLDTADGYNAGRSEEVVGAAIRGNRHAWVLATKIANKVGKGPNEGGLSRKWVMQGAEACLTRLGTDFVDVLYLHKEDHATPLEVTVRALGDLARAGKIRHFGVSNYRSWRIAEICRLCDQMGIDRPVVSQPYYNAMNRQPEVEQIPAAAHYGLAVFPYSPLARGVLTAKYRPGEAPEPGSRAARQDRRILETELRAESLAIAQRIRDHAAAKGASPAHLAINWVLNNRLVTGCILGPRTEQHLEDYLAALAYRFTAEDEALIDALVSPGHPSTPGYNDPQYPIEGRVAATG